MSGIITITSTTNREKLAELCGTDTLHYGLDRDTWSFSVWDVTQEELDDAWITYNADISQYEIEPYRNEKSDAISRQAHEYIEKSYPSFRRELFIALAEEARNTGLANRVAYINQMLIWVKSIVAAVLAAEDMIDSYTTLEEIQSTNLNTEVFASTDPEITIRGAMAIED